MLSRKLSNAVQMRMKKEELARKMTADLNEEDYDVYEPLLNGLKLHNQSAMVFNILFLSRRIIFVGTIFLLVDVKWLFFQLQGYMLGSLLVLSYYCSFKPFESNYETSVEIFNEFNVLIVSYFALQILYSSYDPQVVQEVGKMMVQVIVIGVIVNMVLILGCMFKELKLMILTRRKKRV